MLVVPDGLVARIACTSAAALCVLKLFDLLLHCSGVTPTPDCIDNHHDPNSTNLRNTFAGEPFAETLSATDLWLENLVGPLPDTANSEIVTIPDKLQNTLDGISLRRTSLEKFESQFSTSLETFDKITNASIEKKLMDVVLTSKSSSRATPLPSRKLLSLPLLLR